MLLCTTTFLDKEWEIKEWQGEKLVSAWKYLAIDTETELVNSWTETPRLATFQAFDGKTAYDVYPEDVVRFLDIHQDTLQVFHNYPFDADVLDKHVGHDLISRHMMDNNLIEDTRILYMLVHLAEKGWVPRKTNLALCTKTYLREELPKDDHLRMNWGNYLGVKFSDIPTDVLEYGARDVIATYFLRNMLTGAIPDKEICKQNKLSMDIQVKGDVALNRIYKRGIGVNPGLVKEKINALYSEMGDCAWRLAAWGWKRGEGKSQLAFEAAATRLGIADKLPRTREDNPEEQLRMHMAKYKEPKKLKSETDMEFVSRRSKHKRDYEANFEPTAPPLSTKEEDLKEYLHIPFIKDYITFHKLEKLSSFLKPLQGLSRVHPRYSLLMNTGRTSCSKPNIQQLPTFGGIREVFEAKPGHTFIITDYSALELATLAQVMYARFGESVMRDKINEGQDLHKYYASVMHSIDPEEVNKDQRQGAKAANFGFPGGLGPATFIHFSKGYGLDFTVEEAKEMKDVWFGAFPETVDYMAEPDGYVITETGRMRGDTSYCAEKNTPFQGLAADGAKIALYNCDKAGLDVVAFVHDEIVIEVPEDRVELYKGKLEKIMVDSMETVTPDVKISVESTISKVYCK